MPHTRELQWPGCEEVGHHPGSSIRASHLKEGDNPLVEKNQIPRRQGLNRFVCWSQMPKKTAGVILLPSSHPLPKRFAK